MSWSKERETWFNPLPTSYVPLGVPLMDGGTVRLPALIGLSRAMDMILTGRPVGAEEALLMGMMWES